MAARGNAHNTKFLQVRLAISVFSSQLHRIIKFGNILEPKQNADSLEEPKLFCLFCGFSSADCLYWRMVSPKFATVALLTQATSHDLLLWPPIFLIEENFGTKSLQGFSPSFHCDGNFSRLNPIRLVFGIENITLPALPLDLLTRLSDESDSASTAHWS